MTDPNHDPLESAIRCVRCNWQGRVRHYSSHRCRTALFSPLTTAVIVFAVVAIVLLNVALYVHPTL